MMDAPDFEFDAKVIIAGAVIGILLIAALAFWLGHGF